MSEQERSNNSLYDCVVIGGGPAGTTVAALVASAGFSTFLVEREKMPRFCVGESLMPETYWIFERLGVLVCPQGRGAVCEPVGKGVTAFPIRSL